MFRYTTVLLGAAAPSPPLPPSNLVASLPRLIVSIALPPFLLWFALHRPCRNPSLVCSAPASAAPRTKAVSRVDRVFLTPPPSSSTALRRALPSLPHSHTDTRRIAMYFQSDGLWNWYAKRTCVDGCGDGLGGRGGGEGSVLKMRRSTVCALAAPAGAVKRRAACFCNSRFGPKIGKCPSESSRSAVCGEVCASRPTRCGGVDSATRDGTWGPHCGWQGRQGRASYITPSSSTPLRYCRPVNGTGGFPVLPRHLVPFCSAAHQSTFSKTFQTTFTCNGLCGAAGAAEGPAWGGSGRSRGGSLLLLAAAAPPPLRDA